jgi:amidase
MGLIDLSATEASKRLRERSISATDLVQAHLDQVNSENPKTNAIVNVLETSLDQARDLDKNFRPADLDAKPLWGIPVTVKVNVDLDGAKNTNGLTALKDQLCNADSPVIANLKSSSAVIIGQTNTPEMSLRWFTSNPLHGTTYNPWNDTLTPGGSSGGAASAIASGMGLIAHGNDLGGSLRYPAYCCGVTSIKPSRGRIPSYNPSAKAERPPIAAAMSVQGPIARCVADLKLALPAMSKQSIEDIFWSPAHSQTTKPVKECRIGYSKFPFLNSDVDAEVQTAMDHAIAALHDCGATVIEMPFPNADQCAALWGDLLMTETETLLGDLIRSETTPDFQRMFASYVSEYEQLDLREYLVSSGHFMSVQRDTAHFFADIDAYLMPTSLAAPFFNDQDFKQPETLSSILMAQRPLHIVNLLGLPSVALPTHIKDNVPLGVQLIGARNNDYLILDIAESIETELGTFRLF